MGRCFNRGRGASRRLGLALSLFAVAAATLHAETSTPVPLSTFAAQLTSAKRQAQGCSANAAACEASGLPGHEQVEGGPGGPFRADWQWFGDALAGAKTVPEGTRAQTMNVVQRHLAELGNEAGAPSGVPGALFGRARTAANAALARDEFRAADGPTWVERQLARLQDWLLRLFTGMNRLGKRAPWLAPLIEWSCFGLAAAGLLLFVRQSLARQTLRIALSEGAALATRGDRGAANWEQLAAERAAARDWREAIHCQYWAAIASLEHRRAWKPNATRTPREYLRLLRPGSEAQRALRELTRAFERVWYGHAEASEALYRAALGSFHALEAARPERAATFLQEASTGTPYPAAGGA